MFLLVDLVVTSAAWLAAYWLRYSLWPAPHGVPESISSPRACLRCSCSPRLLIACRASTKSIGCVNCRASWVRCVAPAGLLFLLAIAVMFYRHDVYETRLGLAVFVALNALGLAVSRRVIWHLLKRLRSRGLNHGRALIVGSGRLGRIVAETIGHNRWIGS